MHCYRANPPPGAGSDPLLVTDAHLDVQTAGGTYLVDVTSQDRRTANELLTRAGL